MPIKRRRGRGSLRPKDSPHEGPPASINLLPQKSLSAEGLRELPIHEADVKGLNNSAKAYKKFHNLPNINNLNDNCGHSFDVRPTILNFMANIPNLQLHPYNGLIGEEIEDEKIKQLVLLPLNSIYLVSLDKRNG